MSVGFHNLPAWTTSGEVNTWLGNHLATLACASIAEWDPVFLNFSWFDPLKLGKIQPSHSRGSPVSLNPYMQMRDTVVKVEFNISGSNQDQIRTRLGLKEILIRFSSSGPSMLLHASLILAVQHLYYASDYIRTFTTQWSWFGLNHTLQQYPGSKLGCCSNGNIESFIEICIRYFGVYSAENFSIVSEWKK